MLSHNNEKHCTRLEKITQHSAIMFLLGFWALLSCPLQAQSEKDYIYLDGKLLAVESQQIACSYTLNPSSTNIVAGGGNGSFTVTAPPGCAWTASAAKAWITITSGGSGSGTGTVGYSVSANSQSNRVGSITVAGQSFTINQASYPQPTCLTFSPAIGFAGIDPSNVYICNGASMTVKVRYDFTAWPGGPGSTQTGIESIAGTTDASGNINRNPLPQNTIPGTSVVTAIRNNLREDWCQLPTPYPQYTERPAKPQDFRINNTTSFEVILPASTTESARNSQNQTVEAAYRMVQPIIQPSGSNEYWYFPFPMNAGAAYPNDSHPCEVGNTKYLFYHVRNQLDSYDAAAWTDVASDITYTKGTSCPNFQLQFQSSSTQTITPGQTAQFQFKASPSQGFSGPVTLSASGLPAGSAAAFSQNPVNPNQTVTLTIYTPSNIGPGNYNFAINGTIQGYDAGGWISRTLQASISVQAPPPQPTCFEFSPTIGFAGIDPSNIHVCDAPNITIEVKYTFVSWTGGGSYQGQGIAGTTDSNGWIWRWNLPQNTAPGISYVTAYRNVSRSDWVYLYYSYPQFTARPPKPTDFWPIPTTIQLPGMQWISVSNEQGQTVLEEVQYPNPPGGSDQYSLGLDASGYWSNSLPCGILPGTYVFTKVRNQLDDADDAWLWLLGKTQTILACNP